MHGQTSVGKHGTCTGIAINASPNGGRGRREIGAQGPKEIGTAPDVTLTEHRSSMLMKKDLMEGQLSKADMCLLLLAKGSNPLWYEGGADELSFGKS